MRTKLFLIIILLTNTLLAQQTVRQLRLADCILQALGQNPSILVSKAKVQAAEARSSEAATALLPQLKLTGRMTSEKYKNGLTSNTEMLDAEIALLQSKLTDTQAAVDYTLALARLKKAVGENQ
jgi:outer membrane protein TolC